MTNNVYCLIKIIEKDERIIAAVQFEIKLFDFFSTGLNSSLIIFIRTYTVNYRNALNRFCVRMNIILLMIHLDLHEIVYFLYLFFTLYFSMILKICMCAAELKENDEKNSLVN